MHFLYLIQENLAGNFPGWNTWRSYGSKVRIWYLVQANMQAGEVVHCAQADKRYRKAHRLNRATLVGKGQQEGKGTQVREGKKVSSTVREDYLEFCVYVKQECE